MKTGQLRQVFLEYFQQKGHLGVQSSSLVPQNDPTLLFTNAGMVQFKNAFLGLEEPPANTVTTCQACLRAGGKHNDLENVGYTARHHTFFEMLGNFSFGAYFKKEAVEFAWEFLTQILKIPSERLWVTVYEEDTETADLWLQHIEVNPLRFSKCGAKDNFWSMADTGPCGPCTEIFYDHGPEVSGGPPGSENSEGDRYVEIWNLVFMQFNKDENGLLSPLPKPSVDTGMGLERISAVMQGVHSNYDIDLFKALIRAAATILNVKDMQNKSLRVIADHIRACSFLIAEGVLPSNEGRGYVLRRICRRAIRHGQLLGAENKPFFYRLVKPLSVEMGDAYPMLMRNRERIEKILEQEEIQFAKTLENGLKILAQDLSKLSGEKIPGQTVFKLYDTYGFPVDLTADIARERGLTLDMEGFNQAMEVQRTRARSASSFSQSTEQLAGHLEQLAVTTFTGYEALNQEAIVLGLYHEGEPIEECQPEVLSTVVLDRTSFYAEAGGQVGDQGYLRLADGCFEVLDTKSVGLRYMHQGILHSGVLKIGDAVLAEVDPLKRRATARNHSATHLLHAALRQIVGPHVQQKGSLVEPQRLRFDYTHTEALSTEQLRAIERLVNEQIRFNTEVKTDFMSAADAIEYGAMALFGEKYDKTKLLRVLTMGNSFSIELCGGTHVSRTGDIGCFKIISETGISAGVRRVEALTGEGAMSWVETLENTVMEMAKLLKTSKELVLEQAEKLVLKVRHKEKEVQQLKGTLVKGGGAGVDLIQQAQNIKGVQVLTAELPIVDAKTLKDTLDHLKINLKTAVIVLGGADEHKVHLVVGVTPDCTHKIQAQDLIHAIAPIVGGRGGGRAEWAQAGGTKPDGLGQALALASEWVAKRL